MLIYNAVQSKGGGEGEYQLFSHGTLTLFFINVKLKILLNKTYISEMGFKCAVKNCDHGSTLFRPKTLELFRVWKESIGYEGRAQYQSFRICAKHFSTHQFSR